MAVTKDLGKIMTIPRGAYNSATSYEFLDEVTSEGSTYRYINSTPGAGHPLTDTTYWECIAHKGADGVTPTIDPQPTSGSTNAVSSGGVYTALAGKVDNSKIGANNGIAELDSNGKVPSAQLPSYVDDVLEYASQSAFPATGETGKIYVAQDTNKTYRWSGSAYVEISESLALGETSSTAYAGNKGKANADAIDAMKDGSSIDSFGDVETALAGKVDKVQGKGLSTNDYDNTAKGIVDNIQNNVNDAFKVMGYNGASNLLPFVMNAKYQDATHAGYDIDADGYITFTQTGSDERLWVYDRCNFWIPLKAGSYKLRINARTQATQVAGIDLILSDETKIVQKDTPALINAVLDEDIDFTLQADTTVGVLYKTGDGAYRFNLRHAEDKNITWQPKVLTNEEITDDFFGASANKLLSAVNLFNHYNFPQKKSSHEEADDSIIVEQYNDRLKLSVPVAIGGSGGWIASYIRKEDVPPGKYILSYKKYSAIPSTLRVDGYTDADPSTMTLLYSGIGGNRILYDEKEITLDYENYDYYRIALVISANQTFEDAVVEIMLMPEGCYSREYVPFTMSNKMLQISEKEERAIMGAKNIFMFPNDATSHTDNGIPYTVNDDGSVTVGIGEATADSYLFFWHRTSSVDTPNYKLPNGRWLLSGVDDSTPKNVELIMSFYDDSTFVHSVKSDYINIESEFFIDNDVAGKWDCDCYIKIANGVEIEEEITIYPMIRPASDTDNTWVKPCMTNAQLTDSKANLDSNGKVLPSELPIASTNDLGAIKPDGTTITVDSNGVASASGGGGGTTVVPNPSETATGDLTKVQIGSDIYNIHDTTYSDATASASGLMSSADKSKLNGIANNANNYSLPTAASGTKGGAKVGTGLAITGEVLSVPGFDFSTSEKVIGEWTTGKPLYQRTWIRTVPTTSTDGTDVTDTFNIDTNIVVRDSSSGILNESTGAFNPMPSIDYNDLTKRVLWYMGSTHNVNIKNNRVNQSGRTLYITLRYTKSTD